MSRNGGSNKGVGSLKKGELVQQQSFEDTESISGASNNTSFGDDSFNNDGFGGFDEFEDGFDGGNNPSPFGPDAHGNSEVPVASLDGDGYVSGPNSNPNSNSSVGPHYEYAEFEGVQPRRPLDENGYVDPNKLNTSDNTPSEISGGDPYAISTPVSPAVPPRAVSDRDDISDRSLSPPSTNWGSYSDRSQSPALTDWGSDVDGTYMTPVLDGAVDGDGYTVPVPGDESLYMDPVAGGDDGQNKPRRMITNWWNDEAPRAKDIVNRFFEKNALFGKRTKLRLGPNGRSLLQEDISILTEEALKDEGAADPLYETIDSFVDDVMKVARSQAIQDLFKNLGSTKENTSGKSGPARQQQMFEFVKNSVNDYRDERSRSQELEIREDVTFDEFKNAISPEIDFSDGVLLPPERVFDEYLQRSDIYYSEIKNARSVGVNNAMYGRRTILGQLNPVYDDGAEWTVSNPMYGQVGDGQLYEAAVQDGNHYDTVEPDDGLLLNSYVNGMYGVVGYGGNNVADYDLASPGGNGGSSNSSAGAMDGFGNGKRAVYDVANSIIPGVNNGPVKLGDVMGVLTYQRKVNENNEVKRAFLPEEKLLAKNEDVILMVGFETGANILKKDAEKKPPKLYVKVYGGKGGIVGRHPNYIVSFSDLSEEADKDAFNPASKRIKAEYLDVETQELLPDLKSVPPLLEFAKNAIESEKESRSVLGAKKKPGSSPLGATIDAAGRGANGRF